MNLKFKVKDAAHSELIQRVLFKIGCIWSGCEAVKPVYRKEKYLYSESRFRCFISYSSCGYTFNESTNKEAYLEEYDNYVRLYTKDNSVLKEFTKEELGIKINKKQKMKKVKLKLETAKELYKEGGASKRFALDNYTEEELTKKERIKSWEELGVLTGYYTERECDIEDISTRHFGDTDRNVFKTKEQAEASLALAQLSQVMAHEDYNGDWVPDWKDRKDKYVIYFYEDRIRTSNFTSAQAFLAFKDDETRDTFIKNFEDLILQAKPLL